VSTGCTGMLIATGSVVHGTNCKTSRRVVWSGINGKPTPQQPVQVQQPADQTAPPNNLDVSATVDAGLQREEHGDLQGAMEEYDEVLAKAPDNLSALQAKGQLLLRLGKLKEVIILLRKVADSDPKNERAHYSLALAFFEVGDPFAALAEVEQTLKLDPSYSGKFRTDSNFAPYIKSSIDFRQALAAAQRTQKGRKPN